MGRGDGAAVAQKVLLIAFFDSIMFEMGHGNIRCAGIDSSRCEWQHPSAVYMSAGQASVYDIFGLIANITGSGVRLIYCTGESRRRRRRIVMVELSQGV